VTPKERVEMTSQKKQSSEAAIREIRRRTRRKFSPEEKILTLHGKVDAPEEASLPWGVQDVQKDEKEKSKTIHG